MGRELLESNQLFKETVENINKILKDLNWLKKENSSLLQELSKSEEESRINETEIAQPAIFAIQVGLLKIWESFGFDHNKNCEIGQPMSYGLVTRSDSAIFAVTHCYAVEMR